MVTTGFGEEAIAERFKADKDDYNAILLSALADRLAEAFAERMHQRVRKEFWGYAADETLSNEEMIAEAYHGIRPAPGYPAQPDHTEKGTLFRVLDAENTSGVKLTENYAMWPGSSVSDCISAIRSRAISASARSSAIRSSTPAARTGRSSGTLAGAGAELQPAKAPSGLTGSRPKSTTPSSLTS